MLVNVSVQVGRRKRTQEGDEEEKKETEVTMLKTNSDSGHVTSSRHSRLAIKCVYRKQERCLVNHDYVDPSMRRQVPLDVLRDRL